MSEYISKAAIGKAVHDIGKEIGCEPLAAAALARVMSAVSCIPSADAAPVVHAKYFGNYGQSVKDTQRCSNCKHRVPLGYYCLVCGAEMDEEVQE